MYKCLIDSRLLLSWRIEGKKDGKFRWLLAEIDLFGGASVFISWGIWRIVKGRPPGQMAILTSDKNLHQLHGKGIKVPFLV